MAMETYHAMNWLTVIGLASLMTLVSAALPSDPCDREDSNGCSSPFQIDFPFKTEMTPSCNRHDICYSCAVAYSLSRQDCDLSFLRDMAQACNSISMETSTDKMAANQNDSIREELETQRRACQRLKDKALDEDIDCERDDLEYLKCLRVAEFAYGAVRFFAGSHFETAPLSYCNEDFVKFCLPKNT